MDRYRSTPKHRLDERRYRFRVRFERPPGDGNWALEQTFFTWLDERLGRGKYAFQGDQWHDHGFECRALHFDDHTIIPDLLKRYAEIYLAAPKKVLFTASLTRDEARAIHDAVVRLP